MDRSQILFRASQVGRLMTEPRSKSEILSETTKEYCREVYINVKYGRKKDITNKYIQKGLMVEEDSITLLSRFKKQMFRKNETRLQNEYITGTPDLFIGENIEEAIHVIDAKSSWDIFTFYKAKSEEINKLYYWQLQSYMWLTGAKSADLVYCLINTPDVLITDQKRKFMWNAGILDENPITDEVFAEIEKDCLFDDIPLSERIHIKPVEYCESDIERLKIRIEDCRDYIESLFETKIHNEQLQIELS